VPDEVSNKGRMLMAKKAKLNVLVKIYTLDKNGNEDEIIRQFDVKVKVSNEIKTVGTLGIKIAEAIEKKYGVNNVEAWAI
jgi:hypothetical protein